MTDQARPIMDSDYVLNILACLDRFSLDSVGFTCPTLKEIVDKHLPEEPLRVLESVIIRWQENSRVITQWRNGLSTTLVPESPLGSEITIEDADENDAEDADDKEDEEADERDHARTVRVLRKTAALCSRSFVKFFKVDQYGDWRTFLHTFGEHLPEIRIRQLMIVDYVERPRFGGVMRTSRFQFEQRIIQRASKVESLLMKTELADVDDDSLQWLKEHGIRRLAVDDAFNLVDEDGVRAFCIGGPETADEAAPERSLYLQGANLSFEFLQQLAQE